MQFDLEGGAASLDGHVGPSMSAAMCKNIPPSTVQVGGVGGSESSVCARSAGVSRAVVSARGIGRGEAQESAGGILRSID